MNILGPRLADCSVPLESQIVRNTAKLNSAWDVLEYKIV